MIKVFGEGRLTADPELTTTSDGLHKCVFRCAFERIRGKTTFAQCVAWRGLADFVARNFAKGDGITVAGDLDISSYTASDGAKRTAVQVIVSDARFPTGKRAEPKEDEPVPGDFPDYLDN